jgi:hypothetical protein
MSTGIVIRPPPTAPCAVGYGAGCRVATVRNTIPMAGGAGGGAPRGDGGGQPPRRAARPGPRRRPGRLRRLAGGGRRGGVLPERRDEVRRADPALRDALSHEPPRGPGAPAAAHETPATHEIVPSTGQHFPYACAARGPERARRWQVGSAELAEAWLPFHAAAIESFGADRCMFGARGRGALVPHVLRVRAAAYRRAARRPCSGLRALGQSRTSPWTRSA